ncbi:MAG: TRAM domain-containing protein [Candidatus Micrarchaeia archaeon]
MAQRPPVDVGDKLKVEIGAQGPDGQGIAKIDDFVIFVKNTHVGQITKVKITQVGRTYAHAMKIE